MKQLFYTHTVSNNHKKGCGSMTFTDEQIKDIIHVAFFRGYEFGQDMKASGDKLTIHDMKDIVDKLEENLIRIHLEEDDEYME